MPNPAERDAEGANFIGRTPFFASQHDQRLSYAMYVPKDHTADAAPLPLIVVQHGTARTAARYRDEWAEFAIEHRCAIMTPLFPAGIGAPRELHGFKFLEHAGIRYDHELLHMVEEVAQVFNTERDTFCLHGFSGGGQFAHRFYYAHADRLDAVSIGAPGRITQLDDSLPWWLGTAGFRERFGIEIDLDALRRVPVQMVVGAADIETWEINNVGGANWMAGVELTGNTRVERINTLRESFRRHGIDVRLDLVPGVAHQGSRVIPVVQEFMAEVLRAKRARTGAAAGQRG